MFTLYLTLRGRALEPSQYKSFEELGDGLSNALREASMGIRPRAMAFLLSLMFSDLRGHSTWTWIAEDYEILVAHSDS